MYIRKNITDQLLCQFNLQSQSKKKTIFLLIKQIITISFILVLAAFITFILSLSDTCGGLNPSLVAGDDGERAQGRENYDALVL